MKLVDWLNKPYPFIAEIKNKFLISFSFGLFIYLFLLIFQPFGIAEIIGNKSFYLMGFGLITTTVLLFNYAAMPALFPKYFDIDKWKIRNEIVFIILSILIIALLNYLYNSFAGYGFSQQHNLVFFLLFTVSVGFFPVILMVFITELFLNRIHQKEASEISSKIQLEREPGKSDANPAIEIISESKGGNFTISENKLVFIKSEDNYCKVYYRTNGEIKNQLMRVTLKNIEDQLKPFQDMIRIHRSYIINKKQISKITGNARAYYLQFDGCKETVPISRNFHKEELL
jgi:hypothetical protein